MKRYAVLLMIGLLFAGKVLAGVIVESSRVVFSASDRERSLLLANGNDYPVMVQVWIDDGAPEGTPETAGEVPVIPLPGIFRLEPGEQKNVRLVATQVAQPQDRESLYWLNVYEIPPMDAHLPPDVSTIKIAVRLQLKMFYRPSLPFEVERLADMQRFRLARLPGKWEVQVSNPTPFYATYNQLQVSDGTHARSLDIGMLAPFTRKNLVIEGVMGWQPDVINYVLIDDEGNHVAMKKTPVD